MDYNLVSENVNVVGYVYKITNKLTGKIYIGKRQRCIFDQNYWGSGTYITRAIKKYGKENFDREVIEWCSSIDLLVEREIYWIDKLDSRNPDIGYNLAKGGIGSSGSTWSEESREKLRKYRGPASPHWGKHLSEEHKQHLSEAHKGKKLSEEHKQKISESNKGKTFSEETREKISQKLKGVPKGVGEKNPNYGKRMTAEQRTEHSQKIKEALSSPEVRARMSESHKGKKKPKEQIEKIRAANTGKKRTLEQCQAISDRQKGKPRPPHVQELLRTRAAGRIWIHNASGKTKMIYPNDFDLYESQGWKLGRKE